MSSFTCEDNGARLVVCLNDAKILDDARIREIGDSLMGFIERAAELGRSVAIDFRAVQFISSAMIGKMLTLNKAARARQVELELCNVTPNVLHVFKITRLDRIFRFDMQTPATTAGPAGNPSCLAQEEVHAVASPW